MSLFRRRNAPTQFLEWRIGLFFAAAGIWLISLLTGPEWIALLALVPLGAALLLGYVAGRNGEEEPDIETGPWDDT